MTLIFFFFLLKMTILDHVDDGGSRVLQTHFFLIIISGFT